MSTSHPPARGDLRSPVTPQGRALLDIIDGHLPQVRATAADNDRDALFPADTFEEFRKDGVLGATVPEELGGLGVSSLHDVALALLTLAAADGSTALALHVQYSRGLTLNYEWQHGSAQARRLAEGLLRGMGSGDIAICGAVKDHPSAVTVLTPDGTGGWLLSGRKMLVSMAPIGTHFVVHSQRLVDGEPPMLAASVVPRDAPGLEVRYGWDGLGMRASGTVDVVFDRTPVADEDILPRGPVGGGGDVVLAGQTVSSITMLGIYIGVAQAARDIAVGMFAGRSDPPRAAVRTLVAEIDARLFALRATASAALAIADYLSWDLSGDPHERGRRMMTPFQHAKMMVNQLTLDIVNDCVTAVGGAAFAADHPLARLYRDVRAGWFMQPYTYVDGVDYLSGQALQLDQVNDYVSNRTVPVPES